MSDSNDEPGASLSSAPPSSSIANEEIIEEGEEPSSSSCSRPTKRQHIISAEGEIKAAAANEETQKDAKSAPTTKTIMTFQVGSDVQIQLTAHHTLYDLCDIVNEEYLSTTRSHDYGVNAHLWEFTDDEHPRKQTYVSPNHFDDEWTDPPPKKAHETKLENVMAATKIGGSLPLEYDQQNFPIKLVQLDTNASDEDVRACPRLKPSAISSDFTPYVPPDDASDMDALFPNLSNFVTKAEPADMYLFTPGRKQEQAYLTKHGYVDENIWAPAKFECVEELLYALDVACANTASQDYGCNWRATAIFPSGNLSSSAQKKYNKCIDESHGTELCNLMTCRDWEQKKAELKGVFTKTFPKCAAAYSGKPASQRGWIIYRSNILKLCRGGSKPGTGSHKPFMLQAENQFEPKDESCVVAQMRKRFTSLQEIFCTAEALWP